MEFNTPEWTNQIQENQFLSKAQYLRKLRSFKLYTVPQHPDLLIYYLTSAQLGLFASFNDANAASNSDIVTDINNQGAFLNIPIHVANSYLERTPNMVGYISSDGKRYIGTRSTIRQFSEQEPGRQVDTFDVEDEIPEYIWAEAARLDGNAPPVGVDDVGGDVSGGMIDVEGYMDAEAGERVGVFRYAAQRDAPSPPSPTDTQPLRFRPIKFNANRAVMLTSSNQFPWGILHNDTLFSSQTYIFKEKSASVSSYIYSNILKDGIHKVFVQNNAAAGANYKQQTLDLYNSELQKVQTDYLLHAYERVLETYPYLQAALNQMGPAIQFEFSEPLGGRINVVGRILTQLQTTEGAENEEGSFIDVGHVLSPFTSNSFRVGTYLFTNIIQYVYYGYFFFLLDGDTHQAYQASKDPNLEETFRTLQHQYLQFNTESACINAMKYKFENDVYALQVLKTAPFQFELIDDGFLAQYLNPIATKLLGAISTVHNPNLPSLEYIKMNKLLADPFIANWIQTNRLPDLFRSAGIVYAYLNVPITAASFRNFLFNFYGRCNVCAIARSDDSFLVSDYPAPFYKWMIATSGTESVSRKSKSSKKVSKKGVKLTYEVMYLVWVYISMLLFRMMRERVNGLTSPKEKITSWMKQTPQLISRDDLYLAVFNILYQLRALCMQLFARFTVGEDELQVVSDLLGVKLTRTSKREPDPEWIRRIGNVLRRKFDGMEHRTVMVYEYVETLFEYVQEKASSAVRSKINFYC
jgi:hypothetical protein